MLGEDVNTIDDAVVDLRTPSLTGDSRTFDVAVLEGCQRTGFAVHRLVLAAQGYEPAPAWRGGWHGHRHHGFGAGLALGALAEEP